MWADLESLPQVYLVLLSICASCLRSIQARENQDVDKSSEHLGAPHATGNQEEATKKTAKYQQKGREVLKSQLNMVRTNTFARTVIKKEIQDTED